MGQGSSLFRIGYERSSSHRGRKAQSWEEQGAKEADLEETPKSPRWFRKTLTSVLHIEQRAGTT